jgi:hypothetical protein
MGQVLQFRPTVTFDSYSTGVKSDNGIHKASISTTSSGQESSQGYISNEELYPVREQYNPALATAGQLLDEGICLVNESIKMLIDDDLISSDDSIQRFQALLPELFCCRGLGDGFGAVINSIYHSIGNMNNSPMNQTQLHAILNILKRIHTEPFIEYDEAVEEILHLETAGFEVSPPHFKYVADLLNG